MFKIQKTKVRKTLGYTTHVHLLHALVALCQSFKNQIVQRIKKGKGPRFESSRILMIYNLLVN